MLISQIAGGVMVRAFGQGKVRPYLSVYKSVLLPVEAGAYFVYRSLRGDAEGVT